MQVTNTCSHCVVGQEVCCWLDRSAHPNSLPIARQKTLEHSANKVLKNNRVFFGQW